MFLGNLNCIVQPFASRGLVKLGDVKKRTLKQADCKALLKGLKERIRLVAIGLALSKQKHDKTSSLGVKCIIQSLKSDSFLFFR
jgi:hypothetical protein